MNIEKVVARIEALEIEVQRLDRKIKSQEREIAELRMKASQFNNFRSRYGLPR